MISLISSDLSLSQPQLYQHLRTWSYVIAHNLSMPWSWVNTDYSIHWVLHHPKIDSLLLPASLISHLLGRPSCTQFSTFPQWRVNQWIESEFPPHLFPNPPRPVQTPPSTPTLSIDHGLQVHLQICSGTASKWIAEFTRSRPPSASPHSLDHGLNLHLSLHSLSASKCISKLARLWPPSASLYSLNHGRQLHHWIHLLSASMCISQLTRLWPPGASPNSLDHGLQLHLWVHSISCCKCLFELAS